MISVMRRCLVASAVLVPAIAMAGRVEAGLIIGNLANASTSTSASFRDGASQGEGFTMGGTPYQLESVTFRLGVGNPNTDSWTLALYDNSSSDNPGTPLLGFVSPTFGSGGPRRLCLHACHAVYLAGRHDLLAGGDLSYPLRTG